MKNERKKYRENDGYKLKVKKFSQSQYGDSEVHRQHVKARSRREYHGSTEHKCVIARNKLKREKHKEKAEEFDYVREQFWDKVKDGPDFVCRVCYRGLFLWF